MICQTCKINNNRSVIFDNNCQFHRQPLQSVSLNLSKQTQMYKACKKCEEERKNEKFFSFNEIKQKLNTHESLEQLNQIVKISQKILQQAEEEKNKLISLAEEIAETVMNGIYQFFQFQAPNKAAAGSEFSAQELFSLLTPSTIKSLEDLKNKQISIQIADDMSAMLLTKVLFMERVGEFIKQYETNSSTIQNQMKQGVQNLQKTKTKIQNLIKIQPNLQNEQIQPQLQFMQSQQVSQVISNQQKSQIPKIQQDSQFIYQQGILSDIIDNESTIEKFRGNRKQITYDDGDPLQVKAIMNINNEELGFARRDCICILDKRNNLKVIQRLGYVSEEIITFACQFQDMGKQYIAVGIELQDDSGKIQLLSKNEQKWSQIKVVKVQHSIIKIIHPCESYLITISESKEMEMINIQQDNQQIDLIIKEESNIKDIAQINPSTLIYITSNQIHSFNFQNKRKLHQIDGNEEHQCLEIMNSENFIVGNSEGKVLICTFQNKIQIINQISIHQKDIRYISKIDQMHFVTSSYDGKHIIASKNGKQKNIIKDGPKINFSEPLLWVNELRCLIASSGGQIFTYY
ncbi:unnamed protein product (macronuclear) [Paramecium tetraurelia]|uniref:Uncharacterized protein n=1 Tax=Paramecium tetraurelia TaxID=5888 RepID=A0E5H8_PARTE|nr:uncharacterized protein GSPATT00003406001 [Paramecium tetraurelia]CAK90545.1 unnamed protein product [Paramecium tetraurelia]|eukprot:XP_001457942.1 hypothetical protein (macronuclear) [Paramecium tetraurelia strain d4-2]